MEIARFKDCAASEVTKEASWKGPESAFSKVTAMLKKTFTP